MQNNRLERSASRAARHRFEPVFLWLPLGVLAFILGPAFSPRTNEIVIATLALVVGIRMFWVHGYERVTAAGLWSLSFAVFVGFSGLWWAAQNPTLDPNIYLVTVVTYVTQLAMWPIWSNPILTHTHRQITVAPGIARWGIAMGLGTTVLAALVWTIGLRVAIVQAASFSGLALFLTSAIVGKLRATRIPVRQAVVAAVAVWAFSAVTFTGYGRLILVSLAAVPMLLLSNQLKGRIVKVAAIAGIAPAIIVFALMRHDFAEKQFGASNVSGVGSIVSPLSDFARTVTFHEAGSFEFAHGETFVSSAVVFVPRAIWPHKPDGFGSVLTTVIYPDLVSIGQSVAALCHGEWYFDFGWLGVAAMVPLVGIALKILDRRLLKIGGFQIRSRRDLLLVVLTLLLVCDVPDLMWVGSFGYISRTGLRCIVIGILLLFASSSVSRSAIPEVGSEVDEAAPRDAAV